MTKDAQPQSFAEVLLEADHGRINDILSKDLAEMVEYLTDKASLHEDAWKGEITLKIKVVAEPNGKMELTFDRKIKREEEKMPKARMMYDPDTREIGNGTQVRIKGIDKLEAKPVRSAAAPRAAGGEKGE